MTTTAALIKIIDDVADFDQDLHEVRSLLAEAGRRAAQIRDRERNRPFVQAIIEPSTGMQVSPLIVEVDSYG